MQSKKDSSHPIPEIIVVDDDTAFPSRAVTNQRRPSKRRSSRRQLDSHRGSINFRKPKSTGRSAQNSIRSMEGQAFLEKEEHASYIDSIVPLPVDDEAGPRKPTSKPRRIARRASIDLGVLASHDDEYLLVPEQGPERRKSIDHIAPTVLPWSYDHNTDLSEDSASIDCFDNPEEVVLVGVTGVSKRELIDAMFNATSATLDSSMSHLRYNGVANSVSAAKPFMEPMLSLSDLCSTLMPPRVVVDNEIKEHISCRLLRHAQAPIDSLASAISIDQRSQSDQHSIQSDDGS